MISRIKPQLDHILSLAKKRDFKKLNYILFKKSPPTSLIKLFRYLFVAGAAYAVDFGLLVTLVSGFKINYLIAATISFTFGVTINYLLGRKWVFPESKYGKRAEVIGVLLIGVVGLILNTILLLLLVDMFHIFYVYAKIISTAVVFFWNFFARHVFLKAPETSL